MTKTTANPRLDIILSLRVGDAWLVLLDYYVAASLEVWREKHQRNYSQVMVDLAFTYAGKWIRKLNVDPHDYFTL